VTYSLEADPAILDLDLCLFSGQVFRWEKLQEGSWLGVDGSNAYLIRQSSLGSYEVESNAPPEALDRLLRMDLDHKAAAASLLAKGSELEAAIDGLPGLRMMRPSSVHETLFCFLCTANNHLGRIGQMVRKLASYGEPLCELEGKAVTAFPSLEVIAGLSEEELRAAGFGYRGRSIPMVARAILEKEEGWLESLRNEPYPAAHTGLVGLYSVGPKLADCVALYGLEKLEATPIDTHLWQAIVRLYRPEWKGRSMTDARYREGGLWMRERFGKYAGLAHLYLYLGNMKRLWG
jgi:N-glycosylase/DNA lyase